MVVCKVKRVVNYGAFVDVLEYNKEGFVHISNVSSGWIKNIRSHVNEGQMRVGEVVNVDPQKNLIDISFRKVSSNLEKRKMTEWKREKRADKLFEIACKKLKKPFDESYKNVAWKLADEFGELYAAFEAASSNQKTFRELEIPKEWIEVISEVARDNVKIPTVTVKGRIKLRVYTSDGIDVIKNVLENIKNDNIAITYISAPEYGLTVESKDYNTAEKLLKQALENIQKELKGIDHEFSFTRL